MSRSTVPAKVAKGQGKKRARDTTDPPAPPAKRSVSTGTRPRPTVWTADRSLAVRAGIVPALVVISPAAASTAAADAANHAQVGTSDVPPSKSKPRAKQYGNKPRKTINRRIIQDDDGV